MALSIGWAAVSLLLIIGLMVVGKALFSGSEISKRPNGAGNDGFPSGHVAISVGILTIAFLMGLSWGMVLVLAVIAALIAWQRILTKAHTETQVVAGAVLGFAVPIAIAIAAR